MTRPAPGRRSRRVPGWVVGVGFAVLFLLSGVGFLYGFFGYALSGFGGRPPPQVLWEGQVHLALGVAALLAFPLALWLRTRARAALALLLVMAVLSGAGLTLTLWQVATCVSRQYCDPDKPYHPHTPLFDWISGLRT